MQSRAGAAVGYLYLAYVLRPAPPGVACPPGTPRDPRCVSYQVIVSPPWNWNNGLGWDEVAFFFAAAALARLAIGIAAIAGPPGGLILAFGLPAAFAGLGYAYITNVRQLPAGHSCPPGAPAAACSYQPLIGQSGPWIVLGTLAGVWLAYAVATARSSPPRATVLRLEYAVAIPAVTVAIWWALAVGPDQAGQGYVRPYIVAVVLIALLRLLIAGWAMRKPAPGLPASGSSA